MTHIESRIQNAIDNWGVTYFKFDFLVWLDCVGQGDMYDYKEAFIAMLDRLIEKNPDVTFQIDETNDYRLFPFESVTRGPSWFQNGSPPPDRLLHNLWNLSPYVPAYTLGQHFLGGNQYNNYPVDTLMAIALPGHLTFFSDLRNVPARGRRCRAAVDRLLQSQPRQLHADDLSVACGSRWRRTGPRSRRGIPRRVGERCSPSASSRRTQRRRSRFATFPAV